MVATTQRLSIRMFVLLAGLAVTGITPAQNTTPTTPIAEQSVKQLAGPRLLTPPPIRRSGFIPRLTVSREYNDNLFFNARNPISDFVTSFSPGFRLIKNWNRFSLDADYAMEHTSYAENPQLNKDVETQSLDLRTTYQPNPLTTFSFNDSFQVSTDPIEQQIPGQLRSRETVLNNSLNFAVQHKFSPRMDVRFKYNLRESRFDDPNGVDVDTDQGDIDFSYLLSPRRKIGGALIHQVDKTTSGQVITTRSVVARYEIQLSPLWIINAQLGAAKFSSSRKNTELLPGLSIQRTSKHSSFSASYDRVFSGTTATGSQQVSQVFSVSGQARLAPRFRGLSILEYSLIDDNAAFQDVAQARAGITLEYGFSSRLFLRFNYMHLHQQGNRTSNAPKSNRVVLSVIGSL